MTVKQIAEIAKITEGGARVMASSKGWKMTKKIIDKSLKNVYDITADDVLAIFDQERTPGLLSMDEAAQIAGVSRLVMYTIRNHEGWEPAERKLIAQPRRHWVDFYNITQEGVHAAVAAYQARTKRNGAKKRVKPDTKLSRADMAARQAAVESLRATALKNLIDLVKGWPASRIRNRQTSQLPVSR